MPRQTTTPYQQTIFTLLRNNFPHAEVTNEWASFKRGMNHYSPRVDIAVGPFSVEPGRNKIYEYNMLTEETRMHAFLRHLYDRHAQNVRANLAGEINIRPFDDVILKNLNARCFMAIEIENRNSKKHIMGSVVNAAALGRIGVGVAYTEKTFKTFIRILSYLHFLKRVEKNTYDTTNFFVITKEQMLAALTRQRHR